MSVKFFRVRYVVVSLIIACLVTVVFFRSSLRSEANSSASAALVPVIGATKSVVEVVGLSNSDGNADPGETLEYTVTINNTGPDPATGVAINDTIQNITTEVAGSTIASPIATNDTFTSIGNVGITVPDGASDLLANDFDANNPGSSAALVITVAPTTSAQGGNVSINTTTGSFTYNPAPGFEGADTFSYTLSNGTGLTDTATVTINVAGMIWFINNSSPACTTLAGGCGRLSNPLSSLAAFQALNNGTGNNPAAGDNIFVYESPTAYSGGTTLLANQKIIGQDSTASLAAISGVTVPTFSNTLPAMNLGGSFTELSTGGVNVSGGGNTIRGFRINNTATAKISGTNFGTLTVGNSASPDVNLVGSGQAMNLDNGTFAATSAFGGVASTGTAAGQHGIRLITVGGTLLMGSTTISSSNAQGIFVNNSNANINFGNTSVSTTIAGECVRLENNTGGTRTFNTVQLTNCAVQGFTDSGGGNTTVTGVTTITNPGNVGILISGKTAGTAVSFTDVSNTQSGSHGVHLNLNVGTVTFADLDIAADANQRAFLATSNTGAITTTSGTFADTGTATAVEIVGTSTASPTPLNMQLTSVSHNGGTNGIVLTNTSSSGSPGGFRILGSGGVCTNATPTCTGGTIQNTTANGVSLTSTTNVFLNLVRILNVASVESGTCDSLDVSGCRGALKMTGTVADPVTTVGLTNVLFSGSGEEGITGFNVRGFRIEDSEVRGFGQTVDENGIHIINLSDTATGQNLIEDVIIDGLATANPASSAGIHIRNTASTALNDLSIRRGTIRGVEDGVRLTVRDASNSSFLVTNVSMPGELLGDGIDLAVGNSGDTNPIGNIIVQNNTLQNSGFGFGGIVLAAIERGRGTWTVRDNTISNNGGTAINIAPWSKFNTTTAVVARNNIDCPGGDGTIPGNTNTANPCRVGIGISVSKEDGGGAGENGVGQVYVDSNTISRAAVAVGGIIRTGLSAGGRLDIRARNNVFTNNTGNPAILDEPMQFDAGSSAAGGATGTLCLNIGTANSPAGGNNNSAPSAFVGGDSYRIRERAGATFLLQGLSNGSNAATTDTFVASNNQTNGASPATVFVATSTYDGGTCTTPTEVGPVSIAEPIDEIGSNRLNKSINSLSFSNTSYQTPSDMLAGIQPLFKHSVTAETVPNTSIVTAEGNVAETPETNGTSYLAQASTFFSEAASKLGEAISPTAYAQDTKPAAPESGETITKSLGTLPSGENIVVRFRVTVDNGPYASGVNNITNTAAISGTNFSTVNSTTSSIVLDAAPDLSTSNTDGGTTTQPGGTIAYTVNYANLTASNGQNAVNVVLTETVPVNSTFNAAASLPSVWSCADGSAAGTPCTLNVGNLNAGATGSATFAVNVLAALPAGAVSISNTSSIAENPNVNGTDRDGSNNSFNDTTNIIGNWDGSAGGGGFGNWNIAANWSNDVVPTGNVSIPNVANQPFVNTAITSVSNIVLNGENINIDAAGSISTNANVSLGTNVIDGLGTLELGTASTITHGIGGQVNATLRKNFAGAGPAFEMPVGTAGAFSPLNVTVTAGAGQLTARANTGTAPLAPVPLTAARTLQRYWTLSGSGITSNITFNYLNGDVPVPPNNENIWNVIRVTGGMLAVRLPAGPNVVLNAGANTFTVNNLSTYSDWTAGEPLAPTASNANVAGRVLDANGRGIAYSRVHITDANGNVRQAITNPFGYYSFDGIQSGMTYVIHVLDKRYEFVSRVVMVNDDLSDVDFVPLN